MMIVSNFYFQANNTRERFFVILSKFCSPLCRNYHSILILKYYRIRVRDINHAFKELAKLCCTHMPDIDERQLTKLGTLNKAVELIPLLEDKVQKK